MLHAVPLGDDDAEIDHLVVGPPGVFTISVGTDTGRLIPTRADAEHEAQIASRALSRATGATVVADAVVVVAAPRRLPRDETPSRVVVVAAARLIRHLRGLPTIYSPGIVASIGRAAEEWTTWRPFGVGSKHPDPDAEFERLHREVSRARTRRAVWQFGGIAAAVAAVFGVAIGVAG